jgi:acyl-CoA thioester hydrolase
MSGVTIYRTTLKPEWIDHDGHMRSAYFALVFSLASDALMDRLSLDAAYRASTACTLYSLEMHMHQLHGINAADTIEVDAYILASDLKRLHVGYDIRVIGRPGAVATGEYVYLHVRQGDRPRAVSFPSGTEKAIEDLKSAGAANSWAGPGSRPIVLGA